MSASNKAAHCRPAVSLGLREALETLARLMQSRGRNDKARHLVAHNSGLLVYMAETMCPPEKPELKMVPKGTDMNMDSSGHWLTWTACTIEE